MKNVYRELVVENEKEISKIERFIEEICDYFNINNEYFGNILLAVTEATEILFTLEERKEKRNILIAFDHNRTGLIFKIKIKNGVERTRISEDELDIAIRNHKLSKDIFIIKALADEVTISLNGLSILLVFYVTSINYEKSLQRIEKLKEYWGKKVHISQKK